MNNIAKHGIILTPALTYTGIYIMLWVLCKLIGIDITPDIAIISFVLNSPILVAVTILSLFDWVKKVDN